MCVCVLKSVCECDRERIKVRADEPKHKDRCMRERLEMKTKRTFSLFVASTQH